MVEHHLEGLGAHAGFLAALFSRSSEEALKARPWRHRQAEAVAVDEEHEGRKGYEDWQGSTYKLAVTDLR
jgi:hypothetical protein